MSLTNLWLQPHFDDYLKRTGRACPDTMSTSHFMDFLVICDKHYHTYLTPDALQSTGSWLPGPPSPYYGSCASPSAFPAGGDGYPSQMSLWSEDPIYGTADPGFSPHAGYVRKETDVDTDEDARKKKMPSPKVAPSPAPKKKMVIQHDITSLSDLITITDTYPFSPDTEANIDLEILHNIKQELVDINAMIGLKSFKDSLLDQLLYFIQGLHINREHDYKHMVIYGPPGSGKTQTAKLIASMYAKMGILKNKVFRKVTRGDLVAAYLGQTAIKTSKVIEECLGGCLFIDEVYSLGCGGRSSGGDGGDSFSKECIDTLCEALSDHKDDLMVIVAGYETDVKESFFGMNPGLASRFIWRFTVEEYTAEELMLIFLQKVEQNGWTCHLTESAGGGVSTDEPKMPRPSSLLEWFKAHKKDFVFFGRDMEFLFTYTKIAHGRRIYGKPPELRKILTLADLDQGYKQFIKNTDKKAPLLSESCFGLYL